MPKKIHLGSTNFAELIDSDALWADKSLFIQEIIEDSNKVILIARPRRWGKTLNMSMLHHFFAEEVYGRKTQGLFDRLKIAQEAKGGYLKHQGHYPVIFISFKDVKGDNFDHILNNFTVLVQELFRQHEFLAESENLSKSAKKIFIKYLEGEVSQQELERAIKFLSEILYKNYEEKVYILIDEYDTPLNAAYNKEFFEKLIVFVKNMFSAALKDNPYFHKGIMTGILRISKDSMLSGLNNLKVFTVLDDKYAPYFGFTEEELNLLFKDQGLKKNEEEIKVWYNGYSIGGLTLYNPWSIMSSLSEEGKLRPYWVNTADDSLLKEVLQDADSEIKAKFQLLLEGKSVEGSVSEIINFNNIKRDEIAVWSLLLYAGYLTKTESIQDDVLVRCKLTIPNQEILAIYKRNFIEWLNQPSKELQLKLLLKNLLDGKINKFASDVEDFLKAVASFKDYATQPEAFYHGFMLALTASLMDNYYVESNKESGFGLPDLLFIPKDNKISRAIILEFKHVHKNEDAAEIAKQALAQIDDQDYAAKIRAYTYIKTILKVGLAFDGKEVFYHYKNDDISPLFNADSQVSSSQEKSPTTSLDFAEESDNEDHDQKKISMEEKRKRKRIVADSQVSEDLENFNKKKQKLSHGTFFKNAATVKQNNNEDPEFEEKKFAKGSV